MFWLIDSCFCWPVSPDRIAGSGIDPPSSSVFWRYPLTSWYFSNDRRLKFIFFKCIWNKSCSWAALLKCWFRTDFGRENSTGFYITCREGNRFWLFSLSRVDHALRPILMFWLVKIWQVNSRGKFMQRLETCVLIAGADRVWSGSFVSSCDVLNCLFLLGVQNEIQLLSRLFCNSWLVCLLRFLFTNAPLVKVIGNPISDGIVFKNELTHLPLLEA